MLLIHQDFKQGTVKLKVTELDDLWYLQQILEPGDLVTGKTTRKIKVGSEENAKSLKKTFTLTIEAETIDFGASGDTLRVNGKVKQGPEDVPRESYHALSLEENSEITLQKKRWQQYQKQKLQESCEPKNQYLICILDREEAILALTKRSGHEVLAKLAGQVAKKNRSVEIKKDFQEEIISLLQEYAQRYSPARIVLASPAFYKEELLKKISSPELKKKIVLATCFDVSERALDEVLKRPELTEALKGNRAREEQLLVEQLLQEINRSGAVAYGWEEVLQASESGAVKELLLTDHFIQKRKEAGQFAEVDQLLKLVDSQQGKIHLLSSEHEGGRKLNGLGGIAALLRYKLPGLS